MTPWGDELNSDAPLPEYPRPQLRRDSYLNLNGRWEYAFRINDRTPAAYDGEIVVPFSPEAQLSGVGRQLRPGEFLHYRRNFAVPDGFLRDRVLLHFGAVDQNCTALVNGKTVGTHTGGYLPFTFDVTDVLQPVNELQVVVTDPSDTEPGSRGKQVLKPGGIWYTAQSGIWQTVWLESVPQVHVRDLRIEPALDHVQITVETSAPADCVVEMAGQSVATRSGRPVRIDIPDPQLWTPENPYLYDIRVSAGDDQVSSYAGLRTTEVRGGQLLLNGQPYFHTGVLDQGYWPDGLYTPPSDDAMVFDITTAKDLGFTMLRKHIKVEPLRWYYHCDRLGMLVWQDMVNGGHPYRRWVQQPPAVAPVRFKDSHYSWFGRADAQARAAWLDEMQETIALLHKSPSVVVWVPFNEGWGQFDASAVAQQVRALDPSRPVDHASGWHDQRGGDFQSLHVYFRAFRAPKSDGRVLALTEYGGYSWRDPDHSWSEVEFGYKRFPTSGALTDAFIRLHHEQILPAVARGLQAIVYTQLTDVEEETNGLLTYDRRVVKLDGHMVRQSLKAIRTAAGQTR